MGRRALAAIVGFVGLSVIAVVVIQSGAWVDIVGVGEYGDGTVTVHDDSDCGADPGATAVAVCTDSRQIASVEVRIADNFSQRYTGLSDTESLGPDEGMLFVHNEEAEYAYVMREMSFPIDIIFIAENGTITTIHHAPLPPEGTTDSDLKRYAGRGKYVLEVNRGWANETGVTVGDRVELPDSVA